MVLRRGRQALRDLRRLGPFRGEHDGGAAVAGTPLGTDPRKDPDYGPNKSSTRYSGGTDAWAENMALMWTFRGIPTLYYGSEIEFQRGKQIDCGPTCPLASTGRAYHGDHLVGPVTASDFGKADSATGEVPRPSASPWSSTSNGSTGFAGPYRRCRWASTPPTASPARWRSNAARPAAARTASRSSP